MPEPRLPGKKIAVLIESDFYEPEIHYYQRRVPEEGAEIHLPTHLWGQPSPPPSGGTSSRRRSPPASGGSPRKAPRSTSSPTSGANRRSPSPGMSSRSRS